MALFLDWFLPFFLLALGAVLGSFSHAFIYRYENNIPINKPKRSFCESCRHELKWYDNIPIFSFLILRGKCRYCHEKIKASHFIFEIANAVLFVILYLFYRYLLPLYYNPAEVVPYLYLINILIIYILAVIAVTDYKTLTAPLGWSIALFILLAAKYAIAAIYNHDYLLLNILGFVIPLAGLLFIYMIFKLIFKKEGIGLIDIIIMSFIGLEINCFSFLLFIIFTMIVCLIFALINQKLRKREIPLVPFIASGYLFMQIGGLPIMSLFLKFMGV